MEARILLIGGRPAIRCPNPYCDENSGCCICEGTGFIEAKSGLAQMVIESDNLIVDENPSMTKVATVK